jgi:hypothetical protein
MGGGGGSCSPVFPWKRREPTLLLARQKKWRIADILDLHRDAKLGLLLIMRSTDVVGGSDAELLLLATICDWGSSLALLHGSDGSGLVVFAPSVSEAELNRLASLVPVSSLEASMQVSTDEAVGGGDGEGVSSTLLRKNRKAIHVSKFLLLRRKQLRFFRRWRTLPVSKSASWLASPLAAIPS